MRQMTPPSVALVIMGVLMGGTCQTTAPSETGGRPGASATTCHLLHNDFTITNSTDGVVHYDGVEFHTDSGVIVVAGGTVLPQDGTLLSSGDACVRRVVLRNLWVDVSANVTELGDVEVNDPDVLEATFPTLAIYNGASGVTWVAVGYDGV